MYTKWAWITAYRLLSSNFIPHVDCRVLVGKREGKRPRHRRIWEKNIKIYLQEVGGGGTLTGLIWLRIGTGSGQL